MKGSVILSVLQRYKVPLSYGLSGQGKNFYNKQRLIFLRTFNLLHEPKFPIINVIFNCKCKSVLLYFTCMFFPSQMKSDENRELSFPKVCDIYNVHHIGVQYLYFS